MMSTDKERAIEIAKQKKNVTDSLGKSGAYMQKMKKYEISVEPIDDPLKEPEAPVRRILTNTTLDEILSFLGGIEAGSLVEFYGEFASGKTQIVQALLTEAEGLLIYIDSEHTFRRLRFMQIAIARNKNVTDIGRRLRLYQPDDWIEQEYVTMNLPEYDNDGNYIDVGLIVVDSLMKVWAESPEFYGRENLTTRQQLIRAQVQRLRSYAKRHNAVLVYTNQIYTVPVALPFASAEDKIKGRGGPTVYHLADYRVLLLKKRGNIRVARLVDSLDKPLAEVPFRLDEAGISDLEPAERVKALERAEGYGEKHVSGQVGKTPAGEKYLKKAEKLGLTAVEEDVQEKVEGITKDESETDSEEPL